MALFEWIEFCLLVTHAPTLVSDALQRCANSTAAVRGLAGAITFVLPHLTHDELRRFMRVLPLLAAVTRAAGVAACTVHKAAPLPAASAACAIVRSVKLALRQPAEIAMLCAEARGEQDECSFHGADSTIAAGLTALRLSAETDAARGPAQAAAAAAARQIESLCSERDETNIDRCRALRLSLFPDRGFTDDPTPNGLS